MKGQGKGTMNEKEWSRRLREEGFTHTFVRQDGPDVTYPDHEATEA